MGVQEEKRKLQIEMEKLKTALQIDNNLKKEEFATKEIYLERKTMELSLKQKNVLDKEQKITLLQNEYQQNKVLLKNEQEHVEQSKEKIHSESRALATRASEMEHSTQMMIDQIQRDRKQLHQDREDKMKQDLRTYTEKENELQRTIETQRKKLTADLEEMEQKKKMQQ